jgi:hypothetical protein
VENLGAQALLHVKTGPGATVLALVPQAEAPALSAEVSLGWLPENQRLFDEKTGASVEAP